MDMSKDFALTIPFEKSEREDGWYITGIAAGIDVDLQGERLSPLLLIGLFNILTRMAPFRLRIGTRRIP